MIRGVATRQRQWNGLVQVRFCPLVAPPQKYSTITICHSMDAETTAEPPKDHRPPPIQLLGPPEIYQTDNVANQNPTPHDPFIDALCKHQLKATPEEDLDNQNDRYDHGGCKNFFSKIFCWDQVKGRTENNSPTYLTSGNPCLDFFFHVVPDTPPETLRKRLGLAWDYNPMTALKLACQLRGVRGTGKSDKQGFYTSALWLHENHPKTLAYNVESIAKFGYLKDLPEILTRVLQGPDYREPVKTRKFYQHSVEAARELRRMKYFTNAKKAVDAYNNDPIYQFLYDKISDLFAQLLKSDLENLSSGKLREISLASKWSPSLDSSFDRSTLLCEGIAKRVFPREMYKEYQGIEEAHYSYRVRDRLRKDVLVPLRKALKLPEIYMSANEWSFLPYNRVASVAMQTYKELFLKHDGERFKRYLDDVKRGKAKIAAGALLPHKIIESLRHGDGGEVAELQWRRIVEDLTKQGKLRNCLAICDVSGSMTGTPMDVCIALGILVSELCEEPWKGKVITFSKYPQLQFIYGHNLKSKAEFVETMQWNLNTDFQKVFDQILQVAVKEKLSEDQMIKRLLVFSDMEFDEASANDWETDYMAITRKFNEKGYSSVPEIVFWNLRDSSSTPVLAKQKGVALVSGFSKNILKLFLKDGGIIDAEAIMEAAISGKEYEKLVLVD